MKSFCIKNNNEIILNYLLTEIEKMDISNIYVSKNKFKNYKNIIVHYKGKQEEIFAMKLGKVLTDCVLKFYEINLVKRLINSDYFYFNEIEKRYILSNCKEILYDENTKDFEYRIEKIFISFMDYIDEHKYFILDGFVNFRLFEYKSLLTEVVDIAVNKFIIDKEYKEFIQLLQGYITSQPSKAETVHVIYSNSEPIILDENENVIPYDKRFFKAKYLSDISFSSKDYCLNELLNLLPKKIILHLIAEGDDFINTLQLIFKGRIIICKECNICKTFNLIKSNLY